jgi:predicted transcriptional regulator
MTTKERLHKLVDELSEAEADDALRYVASRREGEATDSFARWLDSRPEDDEPLTAEDEEAIAEGLADKAAGRLTSLEEIKRELGYESA